MGLTKSGEPLKETGLRKEIQRMREIRHEEESPLLAVEMTGSVYVCVWGTVASLSRPIRPVGGNRAFDFPVPCPFLNGAFTNLSVNAPNLSVPSDFR